jgi:hypothetical protein
VEAAQLGLAIAHQQRRRERFDPSTHQTQHIQRRVVRPVDIFEHHDRRRARLELSHQRRGNVERSRVGLHQLLELAARALGDVDEGPERTGREQRITGPPKDARAGRAVVAEASEQRGLAHTGLPTDEHQAPTRAGLHGIQALAEHFELLTALK